MHITRLSKLASIPMRAETTTSTTTITKSNLTDVGNMLSGIGRLLGGAGSALSTGYVLNGLKNAY